MLAAYNYQSNVSQQDQELLHISAYGEVIVSGKRNVVYGCPVFVNTINLLVWAGLTNKPTSKNEKTFEVTLKNQNCQCY